MDDAGRAVVVDRRKWPARPHYTYPAVSLGRDGYGWWLGLRAGAPITWRGEVHVSGVHDGLVLVPTEEWWLAWFPARGAFDLFVDVVTPPQRFNDVVRTVDLDLDVVRHLDGSVQIVDEDELDANRATFRYPNVVVDNARRTAQQLLSAITAGEEPFGRAAAPWWVRLAATLRRPLR
jgi:hypothetical protein